MKNIFLLIVLAICCTSAMAQTEAQRNAKKVRDSAYRATHPGYYVPDSLYNEHEKILIKKIKWDTEKVRDSVYNKVFASKKSYDSLKWRDDRFKYTADSLYRHKLFVSKSYDSLKRYNIKRLQSDSLSLRKKFSYEKADSFHRIKLFNNTQADTFHKARLFVISRMDTLKKFKTTYRKLDSLKRFDLKLEDSLHKLKFAKSMRMDSIKRVLFLQNIKNDSTKFKNYLQLKKIELRKIEDTASLKNGYRSRELSTEITCWRGDTVYINNTYKKIIIKVVNAERLRLSTLVNYKEPLNERNNQLLKKMGISVNRIQKSVTATINGVRPTDAPKDNNYPTYPKFDLTDPDCAALNIESNIKRPLYIEIPSDVIIILNTKFADANVETYVKDMKATITNGTLKTSNAGDIVIKSKYSTVIMDDIKNADITISNTKFTASNIGTMSVVSTASSVYLQDCIKMKMTSVSDDYKVQNAGTITGNKDFGKFVIENLQSKLDIAGANADVKIYKLSYESPIIKIDNKYADVKLPLYDQKNYAVNYEGSYNDVNKLTTATQKLNGMGNITATLSAMKDTLASASTKKNVNKTKFEAVAGDITGKHTKVDIICPYCNVVFN